ncbi:MAG: class GN sortase [Polyangiaceae bacterium]|nr:class GN sortase [Polyangiaceae bacterium]
MVSLVLLFMGLTFGVAGNWIWAKALVAQVLLRRAWSETTLETKKRPWPWADTSPVGRLLSKELNIDLILLDNLTGSSLAFGPGVFGGRNGLAPHSHKVIAAHRDTHFEFLENLDPGDILWIEDLQRRRRPYSVDSLRVVSTKESSRLVNRGIDELSLITCWPFHSPIAGTDERYIVHLLPASL